MMLTQWQCWNCVHRQDHTAAVHLSNHIYRVDHDTRHPSGSRGGHHYYCSFYPDIARSAPRLRATTGTGALLPQLQVGKHSHRNWAGHYPRHGRNRQQKHDSDHESGQRTKTRQGSREGWELGLFSMDCQGRIRKLAAAEECDE